MATRTSGIDLLLRGFSSFISGLGQAQKAYEKTGDAAEKFRRRIEAAANTAQNANQRASNAYIALMNAQLRQAQALDQLVKANNRLDAAMRGTDLDEQEQAAEDYIRALSNWEQTVSKTAMAQQGLTIALNNATQAQNKLGYAQADAAKAGGSFLSQILSMIPGLSGLATAGTGVGIALVGIQLGFSALGFAAKAVSGVLSGIWNAMMFGVNVVKNLATGLLHLAQNVIGIVVRALGQLLSPLKQFLGHVLEIATGVALFHWLQNAGQMFKNLASEVIAAVASFQTLDIRLKSLVARDYARNIGVSMTEAFKATTGAAAGLFDWLRKLAITTPFTIADISDVYTMAQAMSLTTDMSKELVAALINFTSGMGLSAEVMWRLVYNFGQMIQRGKLSGEEFRDLSRNFAPIDDIMKQMAEEAGMTKNAFRDLALEGGVPVLDFLKKFIEMANTDFPEAAKEMARTLMGIQNNLKDFIQGFIGVDIVKPTLDKITSIAADMFDRLMKDPVLAASTKMLGEVLLRAFEMLIGPVDALMDAIGALAESFGILGGKIAFTTGEWNKSASDMARGADTVYRLIYSISIGIATFFTIISTAIEWAAGKIKEFAATHKTTFGEMISRAFNWGVKFLTAFANGLARGIEVVAGVLNTIANLLHDWFGWSATPILAQNMAMWGAKTFEEWIRGFSLADFSMFDDIASLVESYMRSIADKIGGEEGVDLIPKILGERSAIAAAIAQVRAGLMSVTQAVRTMVSGIGGANTEFSSYITKLFEIAGAERAVELASQKVKEAQDAVNAVTKKYEGILASLHAQLTEVTTGYDEQVRLREIAGAMATQLLTAEERERLEMEKRGIEIQQQIRATEAQRDSELSAAEEALAAAKLEEETAKAHLDLLKAQADALKEQIQAITEQNNLLKDQAELLKRIAEANKELQDTIQPYTKPDIGAGLKDAFAGLDKIFAEAQKNADAFFAALDRIGQAVKGGDLFGAFDNLKTSLGNLGTVIGGFLSNDWAGKLIGAWQKIRAWLGVPEGMSFIEWLGIELEKFQKKVETVWGAIQYVLEPLTNAISNFAKAVGVSASLSLEGIGTLIAVVMQLLGIPTDAEQRATTLNVAMVILLNTIRAISEIPAFILNTISNVIVSLAVAFKTMADFLKLVIDIGATVKDIGNIGKEMLAGAIIAFFNVLTAKDIEGRRQALEDFNKELQKTFLPAYEQAFTDMDTAWTDFTNSLSENIKTARGYFFGDSDKSINKLMDDTKQKIVNTADESEARWSEQWASMRDNVTVDTVPEIIKSLGLLDAPINDLKDITFRKLGEATDTLKGQFDNLKTAIDGVASAISALDGLQITIAVADVNGMQLGGPVTAGRPVVVGEHRPELFLPQVNGVVLPNVPRFWEQMLSRQNQGVSYAAPAVAAPQNIDNSIHINVDANYKNMQSSASVRYDIEAALAAAWR